MKLLPAPVEGPIDHSLRDVLTRADCVDRCVSEFTRVTDQLLPDRVFLRLMPELAQGSRTAAGTPVRAQAQPKHRAGRLKQWLNLLRLRHPEAQAAFDAVRTIQDPARVGAALFTAA